MITIFFPKPYHIFDASAWCTLRGLVLWNAFTPELISNDKVFEVECRFQKEIKDSQLTNQPQARKPL